MSLTAGTAPAAAAPVAPAAPAARAPAAQQAPTRIGFAGAGWIGRQRMEAIVQSGHGVAAVICDPVAEARLLACGSAPGAEEVCTFGELLDRELDGIVIATPSALHAEQAIAALERGIAVFCQKPLARTAAEARAVIAAARAANRLLAVDFSYRYTRGMQAVRDLVQRGELGAVYAADLEFHNGYGPDKPWFYDPALAGGGCLMDLGVHLVDLALWTLAFPRVTQASGMLYAEGQLIESGTPATEDHALAEMRLSTGATVRIACSWNLAIGADAVIAARFFGTRGGAAFRNVHGSFYDFEAWRYTGTSGERLTEAPDEWSGRAAVAWAERLRRDRSFDPEIENVVATAEVLDVVYGR
jgi:predicted dehydrogenase